MGERRPEADSSSGPMGAARERPRLCRCVVLVAPNGPLPRPLLRGLEQRGAVAIVATDAPSALVDLAYSKAGALIVQDPGDQTMLGDLLEAVHHFFPRTTCWRYDTRTSGQAALSRLNGQVHTPAARSSPHLPPPSAPAHASSPSHNGRDELDRKLDALIVRVPQLPPKSDAQSASAGHEPLISEEELAMLLGPTPEGELSLESTDSDEASDSLQLRLRQREVGS